MFTKERLAEMRRNALSGFTDKDSLDEKDMKSICEYMDSDDDFEDKEFDNGLAELYAKHIRNYLYKYKKEAQSVNPNLDPNEEHVGPMAQDIEKVAPDCVKETDEGTKVVDGNRLALVNAGVIADIVRRLDALEAHLGGIK